AESIELRQTERVLLASGNVNARLPQVQGQLGGQGAERATPVAASSGVAATATGTSKDGPVVWAVRAARMTYRSADAAAELNQNVIAESRLGKIAAPHMDLILSETNGVQQLSKTVSTGGVTVWQQARKGTSERAEYTAADGRFVLSGGNPTLFDADQGT